MFHQCLLCVPPQPIAADFSRHLATIHPIRARHGIHFCPVDGCDYVGFSLAFSLLIFCSGTPGSLTWGSTWWLGTPGTTLAGCRGCGAPSAPTSGSTAGSTLLDDGELSSFRRYILEHLDTVHHRLVDHRFTLKLCQGCAGPAVVVPGR